MRLLDLLSDPALACGFEHILSEKPGVLHVVAKARTGSLIIEYDESCFDPIAWLDRLDIDQVPRLDIHPSGWRRLPMPLAALRKGTYAFEEMVTPRVQFALGTASLLVTIFGVPEVFTSWVIYASLVPIVNRAVQTILTEGRLGAELLDTASCLVLVRRAEFLPASLMTFLLGLGEFVRDQVTRACQRLIKHQLELSSDSAWLIRGKRRVRVPVGELNEGDLLVVYAGELIAFEGKVIDGQGTIVPANPAIDFHPEPVHPGDLVTRGGLLADGKIYVQFQRLYCLLPPDAMRNKQHKRWLQRTRLQRQALRLGYERIVPILSVSGLIFAVTRDVHRALAMICFDFLTGIRIAIPTAVLASMYKAGKRGIVIRNATALERFAEIDTIVFARSGTLTAIQPFVSEVFVSNGFSQEEVTRFAGAVEQRYSHLAAFAIYNFAKCKSIPVPDRTSSSVITGLGVRGSVEGHTVLVGSTRLMEVENIDLSSADPFLEACKQRGDSRACVAVDGKFAGVIAYQDPLRRDAPYVVAALRKMGVTEIAMTTGASHAAAEAIASKAGISTLFPRTTPEEKARIVHNYKLQGRRVAVVGFDVTDSLALEEAHVAITLSAGTEIARHRADIVLTGDELSGLVEGLEIARQGMKS